PHLDVVRQADDLDRFDAMVRRGALNPAEELLADAAAAVLGLDRESRLGVDVPVERRLLAPDRLVRPQLCCAAQMAVDEGAVEQVALTEAMLGIVQEEVVRHAAAESLVATAGVQTQQMVAKRFHVRRPKPADFDVQRHFLTHSVLADSSSAPHPVRHIVRRTINIVHRTINCKPLEKYLLLSVGKLQQRLAERFALGDRLEGLLIVLEGKFRVNMDAQAPAFGPSEQLGHIVAMDLGLAMDEFTPVDAPDVAALQQ